MTRSHPSAAPASAATDPTSLHPSRQAAVEADACDPLASLREAFDLTAGLIYLDGNSLGVLPRATAGRIEQVVREEWGRGLITSWNAAGWMDLSRRIGDGIGRLIGAGPGEVRVADSTSVNLFKVLAAALAMVKAEAGPERRRIVSERSNFPTDLYIADTLARTAGFELVLVDSADALSAALDERLAVLMLTQVNYRTGALHDMAALTAAAHAAGGLAIWDLAHSAGALPVDLNGADADFAVGCGYKYLNGGPGAPAFVWAHARSLDRMDARDIRQPLAGWIGHAAPFRFTPDYQPARGMDRFQCGTPPVLSMAALECGVDTLSAAEPLGGMPALRRKSLALTEAFIAGVDARLSAHGVQVATPRAHDARGSQVSLTVPEGGYAIVQALIARGVIGDFRAGDPARGEPDLMRFGFTPLYLRQGDVWDAVDRLVHVMDSGEWRSERFQRQSAVT